MLRIAVGLGVMLVELLGQPAAGGLTTDLECLIELEVPRFEVAPWAPSGGTVDAVVHVTAHAGAGAIEFSPSNQFLKAEVEHHLRTKATYRRDCGGKTVTLRFTFRTEGEPGPSPFTKTHFRPPNHFVIIFPPVEPTQSVRPPYLPADSGTSDKRQPLRKARKSGQRSPRP